ncbi:MAG: helix-hairpin-helix domain-containing protein, partial [Tepidiforma sp.]
LIDVVVKRRNRVIDPQTRQEFYFGYDVVARAREARLRFDPSDGKLYLDPDRFVESAAPAADTWDLPDLVIIDGGKGQLSAAREVMQELGVHHIPVVGLAKRHEEIFVPDDDEPIILPRGSEALFLVQRIRDEAHRFAITFHRQVRGKSSIQSALDTIPGIGPKRKKALLKKFGSVKAIREADVDEIAATVGFTRALAERVKAEL